MDYDKRKKERCKQSEHRTSNEKAKDFDKNIDFPYITSYIKRDIMLNVYVYCAIVLKLEIGMDIKRKKVIYVTMATGLGMPLIALFFAMIEIFFFNFNKTQVTFSDIIFYSSSYLSQELTQMIFTPKESSLLLMLPLFVFWQCTIYTFLGWIIARLVYPNKKSQVPRRGPRSPDGVPGVCPEWR